MSIRVLLVDDQELVRTGFRMVLTDEEGIDVVGEAGNGREAITAAERHRPDVIVMDIRMPVMDGIEATRRLAATSTTDADANARAEATGSWATGSATADAVARHSGVWQDVEATTLA